MLEVIYFHKTAKFKWKRGFEYIECYYVGLCCCEMDLFLIILKFFLQLYLFSIILVLKEDVSMTTSIEVEDELYFRFKMECMKRKLTVKEVINNLMILFVEEKKEV